MELGKNEGLLREKWVLLGCLFFEVLLQERVAYMFVLCHHKSEFFASVSKAHAFGTYGERRNASVSPD